MNGLQLPPSSQAILRPMTLLECARHRLQQGKHLIHFYDCYWEETLPGFYQPMHLMMPLPVQTTKNFRPLWSWGQRAVLCESDQQFANAAMTIHLLSDLPNFGLQSLPSNRRSQIRKCQKSVEFVHVTSAELLCEQGYEVYAMTVARGQFETPRSRSAYQQHCQILMDDPNRIVLAGLMDGRLVGYCYGCAVEDTAYFEYIFMADEALTTGISSGLRFEFIQACQRSGQITQIWDGWHQPDVPSLASYKADMGFAVTAIPCYVHVSPIVSRLLRWKYPYKYYRLTGEHLPQPI
jgi:hypothetical protein